MTTEQIQERIDDLNEAYTRVLNAEEYTTADGRKLRRADLSTISDEIDRWERKLSRLQRGGMAAKRIYPYGG